MGSHIFSFHQDTALAPPQLLFIFIKIVRMMQNLFYLLLLSSSAFALVIQEPGTLPAEDEISRTDSTLWPLILNPWQVSHWNCFGTTLYENTAFSDNYTYSVDVCFTAVIAAKLLFPWFYQAHTGHSILELFGFGASSEYAYGHDEYAEPAQEYEEDYGLEAYQAPHKRHGGSEAVYGSYEEGRNGKTVSFQQRLSVAFKDLSKAITKNNPLNSYQ